ncbi:MAG: WGR domain-containing protein [Mesorhizobium sp. SCN 65-20]|nr:MAG: WGR domain-containing protein [Mesorhizobium sp. SCN 65-20]
METPASDLHLERVDATRNMARFYRLSVAPTLFGDVALVREWGRIGTLGRRRLDLYVDERSARNALAILSEAKVKRGYRHLG